MSTIQEALENAASSERAVNIVVLPPNAGDCGEIDSDTEFPPEDPEEEFEPAGELEVEEEIDDADVYSAKYSKKTKVSSAWRKTDAFDLELPKSPITWEECLCTLAEKTPYEVWSVIFTEQMIQHIVSKSELYASRDRNNSSFTINENDVRNMLGKILLSGYLTVPEEQHYWSTQPDFRLSAISRLMSKNCYFELKRYLHFANNHRLVLGDKTAKIAPLYCMLNEALVQYGIFHDILCVDEGIVQYFGRDSMKIFVKGKPIMLGYKVWALCANDGYPYHLKIYQAKEVGKKSSVPLGTRVVYAAVDVISKHSTLSKHHVFLDSFFTSYDLLKNLSDTGIRATGTVRPNRTGGAETALVGKEILLKRNTGDFDYCSDGRVFVAKWHDNTTVMVVSNSENHLPVHTVNPLMTAAHFLPLLTKGGILLTPCCYCFNTTYGST